jgi:hypothetical protein
MGRWSIDANQRRLWGVFMEKAIQYYEGYCKIRFPFSDVVHDAKITAEGNGDIRVILEDRNSPPTHFNAAQFLRYLVKGFITDIR